MKINTAQTLPKCLLLSVLSLLICFSGHDLPAQSTATAPKSIFSTLLRPDTIHLHLKTDLRQIIRKKEKEEYQSASLSYQMEDGTKATRDIQIKTRGNMRLKNCYLPPLQLKFSKKELKAEGLWKKSKLKLVLSCETRGDYEQYVVREYLIYKLYNLLTENSFRVQLVYLFLEDSEGKEKPKKTYAFLIEHEDELANRMEGEIIEPTAFSSSALMKDPYNLLSVFQYTVGNMDWFVLNRHNIKLVKIPSLSGVQAVPFDFDYAGLVNTPYAVPHVEMPINSVTDRYFLGRCLDEGQYEGSIQLILEKKTEMLTLCDACTHLDKRSHDWMRKFLEGSFKILENPKRMKQEIRNGCNWKPSRLE